MKRKMMKIKSKNYDEAEEKKYIQITTESTEYPDEDWECVMDVQKTRRKAPEIYPLNLCRKGTSTIYKYT